MAAKAKRTPADPAAIRALVTDVDGVMTDGRIALGVGGEELRSYHARDGIGLKLCRRAGIKLVIMSSSPDAGIKVRAERLGFDLALLDVKDKERELGAQAEAMGLALAQIAYIGDDLIDIGPMRLAGLACTVADAPDAVKAHADYVAKLAGGRGAVREICEMILAAAAPDLLAKARSCGLSL